VHPRSERPRLRGCPRAAYARVRSPGSQPSPGLAFERSPDNGGRAIAEVGDVPDRHRHQPPPRAARRPVSSRRARRRRPRRVHGSRRRPDARPGALTAGGETAMVRSRGATPKRASVGLVCRPRPPTADRTLDTGGGVPAPTHRAYTHEIPRTPDDSASQSFYGTCRAGCAGHGHSHDGQPGRAAERDR